MMRRRGAVSAALASLALALPGPAGAQVPPPPGNMPLDHPAQDYMRAASLVQAGKPDEAVYWFYRGQLRYRIYLRAHPDLPEDGDPAIFASLSSTLGEPINRYAFGDIPTLAATLDRVLAWHDGNDDPFTPKARFPAAHREVRKGLADMRSQMLAEQDTIRARRTQNGLPNRR